MESRNITLSLPKALIRRFKRLALEREKSVSALLRELMEEAVMTLCEGLRLGRKEHEERIKREERQKYEAAMTEKRPREALGDGVA